MLEVKALNKSFDNKIVLKNVSFKLKRGETVVLLGPNGSGKTTLLKCIAGLTTPDSGTIIVDDDVVFDKPIESRRVLVNKAPYERRLGYVPSEPSLYPHLTLRQNLELPLRKRGWSRSDIDRKIIEVVELMGLRGYEDKYPAQLSSGLARKASIARALIYQPPVLLLDEPFSSIDYLSRTRLRNELIELFSKLDSTVLLTTHLLEDVLFFKKHVIALYNSTIIYDDELLEEKVVSNDYLRDMLGFIKIDTVINRCVDEESAYININGENIYVKFNRDSSICREGSGVLIINPGYIMFEKRTGDDSEEPVLIKGRVESIEDKITHYEATLVIGVDTVKINIPRTMWKNGLTKPGVEIELFIPSKHIYIQTLNHG